jgi:hypothetical protein
MSQYVLTAQSTLMCPHGGRVSVMATAKRVRILGAAPLRMNDVGMVVGCPFTVGNSPSPCVRTQWSMPSARVRVEGSHVLTHTTVALCLNAASIPQGTAVISGFQTRVSVQ